MKSENMAYQLFVGKKFNKFLLVAWWCNIIFTILMLAAVPFVNSTTSIGETLFISILVGGLPVALSAVVLWGYMLVYLLTIDNASLIKRAIWLCFLVIGGQLSAYLYFALVYRRAVRAVGPGLTIPN